MRTHAALAVLLLVCVHLSEAAEKQYPATLAYKARITEIASRAITAELASQHPERLIGVSMALRFQVDARGHVQSARVIAGKPDRWAEKTAIRVLRDTKFPPISKDALRELGMDHIEAQVDISIGVRPNGSNQSLELTASRRENQISMTSVPSPAAARALARSSSSCSR